MSFFPIPQLIDLSMTVSDDPKDPCFFSVRPWIALYRIIKHEEAAFDCMLRQHVSVGDDEGRSPVVVPRVPPTDLGGSSPTLTFSPSPRFFQTTRTSPCCPRP